MVLQTEWLQACVENSAHYCDLAVDAPFVRSIIDEFHEAAEDRGVRIVHACGFDSVPSDVLTLATAHYMREEHGKSLGDVVLLCHDCALPCAALTALLAFSCWPVPTSTTVNL